MPEAKPGRLNVGVLGAGRVGAVLGAALRHSGHRVIGATGVSEESLSRIDTLLPDVPVMSQEELVRQADLVLVTVPDDHIGSVVAGMAKLGTWRPGQIVVHTSGRFGVDVLEPATQRGALALAIHPAMTFTGTSLDLDRMTGAIFAVSAPSAMLPIGQALVVEMGGEPIVVDDALRPAYHAALVHGANHVVTAVTQASAQLARIGVEDPGRLLGPLVHASIEGALGEAAGAINSLTGPVVRADSGTIAAHVKALAHDPEVLAAYRAMARATADLALAGGRIGAVDYAQVIAAIGVDNEGGPPSTQDGKNG